MGTYLQLYNSAFGEQQLTEWISPGSQLLITSRAASNSGCEGQDSAFVKPMGTTAGNSRHFKLYHYLALIIIWTNSASSKVSFRTCSTYTDWDIIIERWCTSHVHTYNYQYLPFWQVYRLVIQDCKSSYSLTISFFTHHHHHHTFELL